MILRGNASLAQWRSSQRIWPHVHSGEEVAVGSGRVNDRYGASACGAAIRPGGPKLADSRRSGDEIHPWPPTAACDRGCVKSPVSCCRWGKNLRKPHFLKCNPIIRLVSLPNARENRKVFPPSRCDQSFHTASAPSSHSTKLSTGGHSESGSLRSGGNRPCLGKSMNAARITQLRVALGALGVTRIDHGE